MDLPKCVSCDSAGIGLRLKVFGMVLASLYEAHLVLATSDRARSYLKSDTAIFA